MFVFNSMTCGRLGLAAALILSAAGVIRPVPAMAQGATEARLQVRSFDIPAGGLAGALVAFSRTAGIDLVYDSTLAAGRQSPGVSGSLSADEALRRLLAGTGLVHRFTGGTTATLLAEQSGAATLPAISVQGQAQATASRTTVIDALPQAYAGGQVARGGRLGLLGNRDFMDTPFSTTSFTDKKIADDQAATITDVVSKDPSVRATSQSGGNFDSFFIRGFPVGEGNLGEVAFDGVYGVAPNYRVMTDYVERIEVIKGPTALLNGMAPNSSVGGGINIVPKRAGERDLTRLSADYAMDSQLGGRLDIGRRYGEGGEFGARFNGGYHDGDTAIDKQSRETLVGSLALDYRGERFRSVVDIIHQTENIDAPSRPFLLATGATMPSAPDAHKNVTQSWEWSESSDQAVLAQAEYDISDRVTLFGDIGAGWNRIDRLFGTPTIQNAAGDTSVTPAYFKFEVDRRTADAGLRGAFDTGAVGHTATFQASLYQDQLSRGSVNAASAVTSNIFNPVDRAAQSVAAPSSVPKISETQLVGFALADTLSAFDEKVQLTLGVRRQAISSDNFSASTGAITSSYDKTAVTPMAGLVVRPWQHVAFYGNYIEGLSKGDIAPATATNAGEAMAPYVSEQFEIGSKVDFGRIAATLSLFEITKPSGQLTGSVYAADGEQRNRGIELNVFGEVAENVRILAGATVFDAELTRTNSASTVGNRPVGVPELQANLGIEWDLPYVDGLTLGGNAIYTGSQYVNSANTQNIPAWTRFDLGLRYRATVADREMVVRLTARNLFDTDYWSGVASWGGIAQGEPRTVLLSTSVDF